MEITALKDKSRIFQVLTFGHSDLNILSYKSPLATNSIFLNFWLEDLSAYQMLVDKELIWERYDFSKMTHELCQQAGFVKKQVQSTSQSIQTDIQVFILAIYLL
jgi:hypothetical protein